MMAAVKEKWDRTWNIIIFVVLFVSPNVNCDNLLNVLLGANTDTRACQDTCEKTYPQHTYPKPEHGSSCKRGCRFYSYSQLSNPFSLFPTTDGEVGLDGAKSECFQTCSEAYSEAGNLKACKLGCTTADATSQDAKSAKDKDVVGEGDDGFSMVVGFNPFDIFTNMFLPRGSDLMPGGPELMPGGPMLGGSEEVGRGGGGGRGQSISMSWSSYSSLDKDGNAVVVESPPQVVITNFGGGGDLSAEERNEEQLLNTKQNERQNAIAEDGVSEPSEPLLQILPLGVVAGDKNSNTDDVDVSKALEGHDDDDGGGGGSRYEKVDGGGGYDWLACISYKSGLPRWLLLITVMMSVLAMVYLCVSTTVTSSEARGKGKKKKKGVDDGDSDKPVVDEGDAINCSDKKPLVASEQDIFFIVPIHDGGKEKKSVA